MPDTESPCRLYVYMASQAPVAVVLRRGPSAWSRLSLWHTESDTFEHGQWHGRVYPRRCDVSPDGSLFAYFIHKATGGPDVSVDSWAAVSRPPFFTSLALWAVGTTYFAGGLFIDNDTLFMSWITDEQPDIGALPSWLKMTKELPHISRTPEWTDQTVHFNRLLRDGWTPAGPIDEPKTTWERRQPAGDITLVRAPALDVDVASDGGRHVDSYALQFADGEVEVLGRATWADFDHRGRLVMAQDGRLVEWQRGRGMREIADFNGQSPVTDKSPSWAAE
ncbi:MAG: hypothetical protein WD359_05165, partial [Dehalococcoidia bacterium]